MVDARMSERMRRILKLQECLRSGPRSVNGLAKYLKVSRRSIFRYLGELAAMGVKYRYDADLVAHEIISSPFLAPLELTLDEGMATSLLFRQVANRRSLPGHAQVLQAAAKIEGLLPERLVRSCGGLLDHVKFHWSPLAHEGELTTWFRLLQQSKIAHKSLHMTYESLYERREILTILSPYRVAFVSRAWYVFGHSSMHGEERTFKISRIKSLVPSRVLFVLRPRPTNSKAPPWSLIPEGQAYDVKLLFSPKVGTNVSEVLWHPDQAVTREDDGSVLYEIRIDGIREISWRILGYGAEVEVLEPDELRDLIRTNAERMLDRYNQASDGGDTKSHKNGPGSRRRKRPTDASNNR